MPRHEMLVTNHTADGAIAGYRITKHGDADGDVAQAAASTDLLHGITGRLGASAVGDRVDVVRAGIAEVEYGGNVTRGNPLTADADGKAVAAAPGAGTNAYIIGFAEVSGVAGDIGSCLIAPGRIQG
jgi:hypothetical protein